MSGVLRSGEAVSLWAVRHGLSGHVFADSLSVFRKGAEEWLDNFGDVTGKLEDGELEVVLVNVTFQKCDDLKSEEYHQEQEEWRKNRKYRKEAA